MARGDYIAPLALLDDLRYDAIRQIRQAWCTTMMSIEILKLLELDPDRVLKLDRLALVAGDLDKCLRDMNEMLYTK